MLLAGVGFALVKAIESFSVLGQGLEWLQNRKSLEPKREYPLSPNWKTHYEFLQDK